MIINTVNDEPPRVSTEQTLFYFTEDSQEDVTIVGLNATLADSDDRQEHRVVNRVCAVITNPSPGDVVNSSSVYAVHHTDNMVCVFFNSCSIISDANQLCQRGILQNLTYINTEDEPVLDGRIISLTVTLHTLQY